MPYYPEVAGAPQNSIIGGASLWVMGGKSAAEYKGVAKFFTFLSDTDRQVELHKKSGYLPITKAAYEKTKASGYYKEFPYLETPLLELTNKEPTENSRGLRFGNMVQLRDVWAEEFEAALAGKKPAKQALDDAVSRGNAMLRQFERTWRGSEPPLSPFLRGEGQGEGQSPTCGNVVRWWWRVPHPRPLPTRGGGADSSAGARAAKSARSGGRASRWRP